MSAAIYVRKSTDKSRCGGRSEVCDAANEHARAYASQRVDGGRRLRLRR